MFALPFHPNTPSAERRRVVAILALAVLGISSSAVLVRGMADMTPLVIAAWRTLGTAALLSPAIWTGRDQVNRADFARATVAGIVLGLHFAVWFASLSYTTVMRSTVLVALVPMWTGLLEWVFFRARPRAGFWWGLLAALTGITVMGLDATPAVGSHPLLGDGLALLGGLLWAVYFLLGRSVRQRVQVTTYMGIVCTSAAVFLFPIAVFAHQPLVGFSLWSWLFLCGAIVGPQMMGHQGSNYAVKFLPASTVSTVLLLEPVGASILAALFLGEIPTVFALIGGAIVVTGVVLATRA